MNKDYFWIFGHLGLGDHITMNALYRHYAELHKTKAIIIPIWDHNLAAVQFMLDDCKNVFFYPIETEQQLLTCKNSIDPESKLCLGFYGEQKYQYDQGFQRLIETPTFNPVKWDSEFYRQAGLDPELKWTGFKLSEGMSSRPYGDNINVVAHEDRERGFIIKHEHRPGSCHILSKNDSLLSSVNSLHAAHEIHCIDSSMLNLADLMETPHCKRFVFHRYARKGLPPQLKKNWEVIE